MGLLVQMLQQPSIIPERVEAGPSEGKMQRWYYRDEREQHGPLTASQMRAAARAGKLRPHHLVSQNNKTWFDANRVRGLFDAAAESSAAKSGSAASTRRQQSRHPSGGGTPHGKPIRVQATEQWNLSATGSDPGHEKESPAASPQASDLATDQSARNAPASRYEPTERWDISSASSAYEGGSVEDHPESGSEFSGDSSSGGDIFDEPASGSSEVPHAGATMIVRGLMRGTMLGNYEILETLGEGGMGTVLKARHVRMDRLVALKILRTRSTQHSGAIRRFQKEVRAASRLSHPNIVTAYDADEVRGVHFLVMEFVEGCDLEELLSRRRRLPHEEAAAYILQAAQGLAFAHKEGVIHRDIKPANLMLDKRNVIKILDLGLASVKQDAAQRAQIEVSEHLTQADQLLGTFDYMSPEQAVDARKADHRADIYSLGCTLFKLVTGVPPYRATTTMEKILAHRELSIPMMSTTCPDVPFDLDAVFGKMVAKEPAARYQTMDEVVKDLHACLTSQPISAWQTGSWRTATSGESHLQSSDEKLKIEPPKYDSADALDEYTLSPLDDRQFSGRASFGTQDTAAEAPHPETKDAQPGWYWRVMGEIVGPLTLSEIRESNVNSWDEVRREDSEDWTVAQDVKELFG